MKTLQGEVREGIKEGDRLQPREVKQWLLAYQVVVVTKVWGQLGKCLVRAEDDTAGTEHEISIEWLVENMEHVP